MANIDESIRIEITLLKLSKMKNKILRKSPYINETSTRRDIDMVQNSKPQLCVITLIWNKME